MFNFGAKIIMKNTYLYINGVVTKILCLKGVFLKLYFNNYSSLDILYEFERKITGHIF